MKLIVGLGNPGDKYQNNRHNIGFVVVERLVGEATFVLQKKFKSEVAQVGDNLYIKPHTYMNDSGYAVAEIAHFYKLKSEDIYVIHDDLDITIGSYKIARAKGPQIHNGLLSIYLDLGTKDFWHVRVGVENREIRGNKGVPGVVYSLQDFTQEERRIIAPVIDQVVKELETIVG